MKSEQASILISSYLPKRQRYQTHLHNLLFLFWQSPLLLKSRRDDEGAVTSAQQKRDALAWQKMTPHLPICVSGNVSIKSVTEQNNSTPTSLDLLLHSNALRPLPLLTGATGRTGLLVTKLMLDQKDAIWL